MLRYSEEEIFFEVFERFLIFGFVKGFYKWFANDFFVFTWFTLGLHDDLQTAYKRH
jgi:hypothetical protein